MRRKLPFSSDIEPKRSKMEPSIENITLTIKPDEDKLAEISARSYQTELMEQAKLENLIVCLPTGSGKTYIAVMLIKEMANSIRESLKKGGKRTIFLVKTVQLVEQQSEYIRTHTDLTVGVYYGSLGVDYWDKDQWDNEFEIHQVLVFTAQVFLNIIDHDFFSLNNVNLIIFDECHHASGDNQYASLMNKHYDTCFNPPRILGLTASISSRKITPKKLAESAKELEKIYRARIESSSNRNESNRHGTSAVVETIPCTNYREQALKTNESLTIPFDFLHAMKNIIENYLSEKKNEYHKIATNLSETMLTTDYRGENLKTYQNQSSDYTSFTQSQSPVLVNFKRYLENLIEIGYELGLLGLYLFAKDLRKKLKTNETHLFIINSSAKEIFDDIFQRLECLVDDILENLYLNNRDQYEILFSSKVLELIQRIIKQQDIENTSGRCIVFVERVYTATILSQVLTQLISSLESPWDVKLKAKHVTGIKAIFSDKPMTVNYQREIIREFRSAKINILVATAVVEEGLDIPQCDLVVRFNKPNNFSSYMQSKGRARAKQNAFYVLFMDESNADTNQRDLDEYDNYEQIEKMIQDGFPMDDYDDNLDDDLSKIPPYRPSPGVVIDAVRAAQLIMEYCVLLGSGQIFPPRFLFNGSAGSYTCILSMPANCPIRDDIICKGKKKKLAKYECCLEMVKKLHAEGEFDAHCLPNRNRTLLQIETPLENKLFKLADELYEKKSDSSFEILHRQIAVFPQKNDLSSTNWYLYQINNELGFVTPCEYIKIPKFHIYGENEVIEVIYLKSIDYKKYETIFEEFCRYLFEYVFDDMNTNTILRFDIEHSTFKSFPCLLTQSGDIDDYRMRNICNRKDKYVKNYSELIDNELYWPINLTRKQFFINISDYNLRKRGTDEWDHKKKSENIKTYADYFREKQPEIDIQEDLYFATMKGIKPLKINYLKDTIKKTSDSLSDYFYYPIEHLRYAPLNQNDLQLIYKLPSIFIRISELYRIEKLRKLFAQNIPYSLLDVNQMPPVTFTDGLKSNANPLLLPLIPLTYDNIPVYQSSFQPSSDIIFQAITRRSIDENVDMENLEILGDCFLKLTVSMSLYHRYPLAGAGALTIEKGKQISNGNLYRIAVQKKFKNYLNAMKINFRGEDANWIPPGYVVNQVDLKRYTTQKVKRKAVADMMEGLIGAFLISTNYSITMQFMAWLGLDVIPPGKEIPSILCSCINENEIDRIVMSFYEEQAFANVEKTINYEFKNKAYLIAAFTHPSSFANRLTNCYERLEFLGDAVLDFLATRHIFIEKKDITPGQVTDIRQDLSNNGRLAYILVACGLHKKILHNSPDLFGQISLYTANEDLFPKDELIDNELDKDIDQWADSTAPKALADVFEALVGAIFLDSGKCLEAVWKVIEPLLRNYLDRSIYNPNLNPVRSFFERGGKVILEYTETDQKTEKKTSICIIEATNGYQFRGFGANKKMAKYDACQIAIKLNLI